MLRYAIKPDITMFARGGIEIIDGKAVVAVIVGRGADDNAGSYE